MTNAASEPGPMAWLPTADMTVAEAAVLYAEHGFHVVEIHSVVRRKGKPFSCSCRGAECKEGGKQQKGVGKHPVGDQWQKRASSDPEHVRDTWRARPTRNVGLLMGGDARLVALDVDGEAGRASLAALEAEHGALPPTLSSRSGREDGGEHRIFRVPETLKFIVGSPSAIRPGLDIRGTNGQIVVAPSEHNTGRRYEWTNRVPAADMPEWLYNVIVERTRATSARPAGAMPPPMGDARPSSAAVSKYVAKVLENACAKVAAAGEGGRNALLFATACTVFEYHVGERIDHTKAWDELTAAGTACGLSKGEVHKVLSNAWDTARKGPGRQVPLREVPRPASSAPRAANGDDAPPEGYPADWEGETPAGGSTSSGTWWDNDIRVDNEGRATACEYNAVLILRGDPAFRGRVTFDDFTQRMLIDGKPFQDADEVKILIAMQRQYTVKFCASHINAALKVVAQENAVDTLKMKFDAFPAWDGTHRIETWLEDYLGVQPADDEDRRYTRMVGRKWLIQAIARVYVPGPECQADATLMLIGDQGVRKSTAVKLLGGAFFTDQVANINDEQKSANSLHGKHVVELAEMAAFKGVSPERVKQWLLLCEDHYTPKYVRHAITVARRCVFIATTNHNAPLVDVTGNRRFWPVRAMRIDIEALRAAIPQLWAEAIAVFRQGEKWWLTEEEEGLARAEQELRSAPNAWEELIADYLTTRNAAPTMREIIVDALGLEKGKCSPHDQARISDVMAKLGWEVTRPRAGQSRARRYQRVTRLPVPPAPRPATSAPVTPDPGGPGGPGKTINDSAAGPAGPPGSTRNKDFLESPEVVDLGPPDVLGKVLENPGSRWTAPPEGLETVEVAVGYPGSTSGSTSGSRGGSGGPETPFADWVDAELGGETHKNDEPRGSE